MWPRQQNSLVPGVPAGWVASSAWGIRGLLGRDSDSLWWWFSYLWLGRVSHKPQGLGVALNIPDLGT